jgi:ABC-type Na+ efflux pump permease subunit
LQNPYYQPYPQPYLVYPLLEPAPPRSKSEITGLVLGISSWVLIPLVYFLGVLLFVGGIFVLLSDLYNNTDSSETLNGWIITVLFIVLLAVIVPVVGLIFSINGLRHANQNPRADKAMSIVGICLNGVSIAEIAFTALSVLW